MNTLDPFFKMLFVVLAPFLVYTGWVVLTYFLERHKKKNRPL